MPDSNLSISRIGPESQQVLGNLFELSHATLATPLGGDDFAHG